jgi:FixJ family two-component response regulator
MDLVAEGKTSEAIASQLGLRKKTVEVYRSHINRKMEARNLAHLIRMIQDISEASGEEKPNGAFSGRAARLALRS